MKEFIRKHENRIHGVLSCFDRMLFRGHLPIISGWAMAQFLNLLELDGGNVKPFLLKNSERVKEHAVAMARKYNRRFEYLRSNIRKEDRARQLAERDGIREGLVCVFSIVENCRTFSLRFTTNGRYLKPASRKCLHFYYYFMDRDFGLIHVRIQSWFPMQIQVYVNGHEWLARKLEAHGIVYSKLDNVLVSVGDITKAQKFADRFQSLNWPKILNRYAKRVNPQMQDILRRFQYYWVTTQSEYSTDVLFKSRHDLCELYPQLLSHSTLCFGAQEVMNFLGRKLTGNFQGEIISELSSFACRRTGGSRIKHRVKENWLKMYDKAGLVLRVETVINNPEEFRVRKRVMRKGKSRMEWVDMRKGVAWLFRYREVSLRANSRYLDALAVVDDPTNAKRDLDRITTRKKDAAGRGCSAFNPLAHHDVELFRAVMDGEHCLRGFTNRDIRSKLQSTQHLRSIGQDRKKASSKVSRIFRRFHAHGLIAKIPRSRRWRVTHYGRGVMGTALYLREHDFARAYARSAA